MSAAALFLLFQVTAEMAPVAPGTLEGRPPVSQSSPLQGLVDRAAPGALVEIPAGTYAGDLFLDRPVRLVAKGTAVLIGSGAGSVVRVRADGVSIDGFLIDGRGGGDLGKDASGIHVAAKNVTIANCRIVRSLFGVYLREADGARVLRTVIEGIRGKDPGEKGSGIHVFDTNRFVLEDNDISDTRDGIYVQSSGGGFVRRNRAHDLRYGLHYMFSDDNVFEDNTFENGAAGTALMYSKRIRFRRNRFLRNRGFASVGLLLKACDEVVAEDNLIADNARGVFLEGSYGNVFLRNVIAQSDVGIVLYDSCARNRFEGNSFVANLTPLTLVGKRTDTLFQGNYWSENDEPDLDGDGRSDRPYRLTSVFDHLRGNLLAADLLTESFAAAALGAAERNFPVLDLLPVLDASPLARPPSLPRVPRGDARAARADVPALAGCGLTLLVGIGSLARATGGAS